MHGPRLTDRDEWCRAEDVRTRTERRARHPLQHNGWAAMALRSFGTVVLGMTEPAPDGILYTERIILETEDASNRSKPAHESLLLNVVFAYSASAKLADCSRLLFAFNTLHVYCGMNTAQL